MTISISFHNYDTDNIRYLERAIGTTEKINYYDLVYQFYAFLFQDLMSFSPFGLYIFINLINILIFTIAFLLTLNHLRINDSKIIFVYLCIMLIETNYQNKNLVQLSNFGLQTLFQFKSLFYFLTIFLSITIMYSIYQYKQFSISKLFFISIGLVISKVQYMLVHCCSSQGNVFPTPVRLTTFLCYFVFNDLHITTTTI